MRQRLDRAPGWLRYLLNALVEGTIGNLGYALFLVAAAVIGLVLLLRNYVAWVFVVLEALAIVALLLLIRSQDADLSRKEGRLAELEADLTHARNTVKLDDNLFPLISALVQAVPEERGTTLERLLIYLLQNLTEAVGSVSRGVLLRRIGDDLVPWVPYEMPQNRLRPRQHIGVHGLAASVADQRA